MKRRSAITGIINDKTTPAPPVVAVSGVKNSGKTTLLAALIPRLRERGLRVAVIKHDGHDFVPDVPGTDSFRLRQAGADTVAVYSSHRYLVTSERPGTTVAELLSLMGGADLVLLEGGKASPYRKIEIVRAAVSAESVCDPATLLALCTDTGLAVAGVPSVGLADYAALVDILVGYAGATE